MAALHSFSANLRNAMAEVAGDVGMEDRCWELAQLNIKQGGAGIRAPDRHAAAAYLASAIASRELCMSIDPAFDINDSAGSRLQSATDRFNEVILEAARAPLDEGNSAQKRLSGLIDAAAKDRLLRAPVADTSFKAHVALCSLPTAGVWLTARPAEDEREMHHSLFQIALKRRLRMRVFDRDTFCLSCGACMDSFADHALQCQCSGDRTVRHNRLRNQVCDTAAKAGLRPEKEKAGLLPQRPGNDGLPTVTDASRRRPADVWLPSGPTHVSEALDFACTSGLQADMMERVVLQAPVVFSEYENFKRSYKNTDEMCEARGFKFTPMIAEAHSGAWSPAARAMFAFIAGKVAAASSTHTSEEVESLHFAQRLSITLQRENARAIMRRSAEVVGGDCRSGGWEDWVE